ncbi:hypothetical protein J4209_00220 [Candidatus Woesearchaeota archaeon]|nr:hypothetical protein [Candidatus Woesearchaeota archaeon]
MATHTIKKENSKLTLSIDRDILSRYKEYCEKEGIIISKQVEKFMLSKLKEN